MSNQESPQSPPPQNTPPERFQPKVLLIWAAIIGVMLLLFFLSPNQSKPSNLIPVAAVVQAAEEGRIKKIVIKPEPSGGIEWYTISGEFVDTESAAGESLKIEGEMTPEAQPTLIFEAKGRLTEERYNLLTDPKNSYEPVEKPASTLLMDVLLNFLPFILIIGLLYFLFVRQLRMAGKGAMSFGKSRAKMLTRDKERALFKDVAGCDEAKEEVSEVVEFLRDPKKFQRIGGRVPKGVLMVGPPGTGKTLLAKAVAGEADVPFFTISGSDFVEMFVGVGAARVRDMFEQGRKNAPCIIFIDEIDAVGRQRGAGLGGGNDEREQTLNSLLVEMDGFDGHEGIIIIAATNRPDVLDSALMRPGRFDRQISIDLPDLNGREEILKVHAKKIKLTKNVNLRRVAQSATGFSGADLANLLNEAALIAARHNKKEVQPIDIEEAHDKIRFGRERRKLMDDEDKQQTAYHEAGHALIQALISDKHMPLHKVTILPRGRALGMAMTYPTKDLLGYTKKQLLNQICMAMGGRLGEEITTGDFSSGAEMDIKQATKIARHMVCDWGMSELGPVAFGENQDHIFLGKEISRNQNYSEDTARQIDVEISKVIVEQYKVAEKLITDNRKSLEKIAESLLQYETLEGKHVNEIIEFGEIRSEVVSNTQKTEFTEDDGEKPNRKEPVEEDDGEEMGPEAEPAGVPA